MISSGATFYLREAPRGSVHSLKEEKEERNENIPSIQDLLEKYQRYGNSARKFNPYGGSKPVCEKGQPRDWPAAGHEYSWLTNTKGGPNESGCCSINASENIAKCQRRESKIHDRKILTLLVIIDVVKRRRGQFEANDTIIGVNAPGRVRYIDIHKLYDNAKPIKHMHNNHKKVLRETQGCNSRAKKIAAKNLWT
jgi:hypothetical protein